MLLPSANSVERPSCGQRGEQKLNGRPFPLLSLPDIVLRETVQYLDNRALKNLRQTCCALSYYATRPLFSSITLTPHALHFDHLFQNLLKHESPLNGNLARHIRTLNFETRYPSPNPPSKQCFWLKSHMHVFTYEERITCKNIRAAKGEPHFHWMVTRLHALLQQLPNLERIVINDSKPIGTEMTADDIDDVPMFHRQVLRTIAKQDLIVGKDIVLERDAEDLTMYVDGVCLAVWAALNGADLGGTLQSPCDVNTTRSARSLSVRLQRRQRAERKSLNPNLHSSTQYLYALPKLGVGAVNDRESHEKADHGLVEAAEVLSKIVMEILHE